MCKNCNNGICTNNCSTEQVVIFPRADPAALARFNPATKICDMNCSWHIGDPRSDAEKRFLCSDCMEVIPPSPYLVDDTHPNFEGFIRAFWRRIEPYKNDYGRELPKDMPIEFRVSMATAMILLTKQPNRSVL